MATAAAAAVKAISKQREGGKRGRREGRCQTTLKTAPGGESGGTKASSDYLGGQQRPFLEGEGATFHEMSWSENKSYVMFCLALKNGMCQEYKNESCSEGRDEFGSLAMASLQYGKECSPLKSQQIDRHSP